MKKIAVFLLFLFLSANLLSEIVSEQDINQIENILKNAGEKKDALDFLKDWSSDTTLKTDSIISILNNPLKLPALADNLNDLIQSEENYMLISFLSDFIWDIGNGSGTNIYNEYFSHFSRFFSRENIKEEDIFNYIEEVFGKSSHFRELAFKNLAVHEKDLLTYLSFIIWFDDLSEAPSDILDDEKRKSFENMNFNEFNEIINKIVWQDLKRSFLVFYAGYDALSGNLQKISFSNETVIKKNTEYGLFGIGSSNDDIYKEDFSFLLDPSGNDSHLYSISADFERPFYMIIDMKGDDIWKNKETAKLACVTGGIGISADMEGSDTYYGGPMSFCTSFGFQYHRDQSGNDTYRTGKYSLAAGTFGISIIDSISGNDIYYSHSMCQGFGGPRGTGILIDRSGHDLYYSGAKYFHSPLRPDDFLTMSQGFGFGLRPDWGGGTGVLFDQKGNDTYQGGVYCQGTAYWYSLGMHIDLEGNDFFNAVQYAQGSGIHLAAGLLYNRAGDDRYFSRYGPGHGAGHDFAVGFFIDDEGDDFYSIDGGNGMGINNSVGIFIERSGNDQYERNSRTNYGYANLSRESGSIGIFMDYNGDDIYPSHINNNDSWANGYLGLGIDIPSAQKEDYADRKADTMAFDRSEIDSVNSVEELFNIASEWEVGENIERVKYARERLNSTPDESAEYIFENRLASPTGLEYRAIDHFIGNNREISLKYLLKNIKSNDSRVVKTSLGFLAKLEYPNLTEIIEPFLEDESYTYTVISALGSIKTDRASNILKNYINNPSEKIRLITARSLKQQNTEKSRMILLMMKDDPSFLIRSLVDSISNG